MPDNVEPRNLGALERSVNDAAGKTGALWLSFISLATYLLIAAGSVTHIKLLLQEPLTLPIFNVALPLLGFFIIAPVFFLLFHFYLFLQLHGLSKKLADYNAVLRDQVPDEEDRRLMRQRLDSFIFVQLLAGPRERREGYVSRLLSVMAGVTMIGLPLAALLYIDFTFLAYHNEYVTWWHRALICLELALIWSFWPAIRGRAGARLFADAMSQPRRGLLPRAAFKIGTAEVSYLFAAAIVAVTLLVAVFPGETIYTYTHSPITRLIFEGRIDPVSGHLSSPFANRLIVTDQTIINPTKLEERDVSLSMRGRDLRNAVFSRSDMRRVDFTGAILTEAVLIDARLEKARFLCGDPEEPSDCADLRSANLSGANLQGATFLKANLHGARFDSAKLGAAVLQEASLCAASLRGATMNGATLLHANLAGASLSGATGEIVFDNARLKGAAIGTGYRSPVDYAGRDWRPAGHIENSAPEQEVWAQTLFALVCRADGEPPSCNSDKNAPHVARGLIYTRNVTHLGKSAALLVNALNSPEGCAGAKGLDADDLAELERQRKSLPTDISVDD